ncbi:MAG TPA: calcium-binding protein, partial [Rhodobacterales bacterium]|nr:calcium-binding protein [Rhodobacterales bacterium]
ILSGTGGDDILRDDLGADDIRGYGGNDEIYGLDGYDVIRTGRGNDTAYGGDCIDVFVEVAGKYEANHKVRNHFFGGVDDDKYDLTIGKGFSAKNDTVRLNVTTGVLTIDNHNYRDTFDSVEEFFFNGKIRLNALGSVGEDMIQGARGNDLIKGFGGNDVLFGGMGRDRLFGGSGDDDLRGQGGNDKAFGGTGNDQLHSEGGNDVLKGGTGSDWLDGGMGRDKLFGGVDTDRDTFYFGDVRESGPGAKHMDVLYNFTPGTDKINLMWIDANTVTGGDDAFAFTGALGADANAVWTKQRGNDLLVLADNSGDGVADLAIKLIGVDVLTASDFFL